MSDQMEIKGMGKDETRVDTYKFATPRPIKGYPELHWHGKRPFTSTQYYPAQLKETYGEAKEGWLNKIFWGDNLQVMSHLLKEYRGKVDLIYIDPPFDSKADYKMKIELRGKQASNDHMAFEEKQYGDIWTNDQYLQFMYERLVLMRELLSDSGSIYVHCDWRMNSCIRLLLDELFGRELFNNAIAWHYSGWNKNLSRSFEKRHDTILFYSKSNASVFNSYFLQWASKDEYVRARKQKIRIEEDGREYVYSDAGSGERVKSYLDEVLARGVVIDDVWDLDKINNSAKESLGYPTQKPEALLERIIKASSNPGDLVFDCFMGSGTTQALAMKLGRRFIGADINLGAIQVTTKRLLKVARDLEETTEGKDTYTGFEVYNVNNYDVFRNPVQARELLIQALEIQPLPAGMFWDGEKDGRMVKIMPVNRIACKADLAEFTKVLGDPAVEKRYMENPNRAVLDIALVCMGHEPDLAAELKTMARPMEINVEIVDILRNKSELQFKREAEAEVKIVGGKLKILSFYPMNLLNKLSLDKTAVQDWKELVDSVMIDFHYDGVVLTPTVVDVPDKKKLVAGEYPMPKDHGNIRIKITDLLSESLELDVEV